MSIYYTRDDQKDSSCGLRIPSRLLVSSDCFDLLCFAWFLSGVLALIHINKYNIYYIYIYTCRFTRNWYGIYSEQSNTYKFIKCRMLHVHRGGTYFTRYTLGVYNQTNETRWMLEPMLVLLYQYIYATTTTTFSPPSVQ